MTFLAADDPLWLENTLTSLTTVALDLRDGQPLLVLKPSNQVPHIGGELIDVGSDHYALLEEMVQRLTGVRDDCGELDGAGGAGVAVGEEISFDPGFRRMTQEQFNRSLADLHGSIWQSRCMDARYGANGCQWPRDSDSWYERFTSQTYGYWHAYQIAYPQDSHVPEPGEPRGGFRRWDSTVYAEHVNVWTGAVMSMATDNYAGWVGWRLVRDPCLEDNGNDVTNFETDQEVDTHCLEQFIVDFGGRAFRRPLTADEVQDFLDLYRNIAASYPAENFNDEGRFRRGLRDIIAVINLSPEFLYRVEIPGPDGQLSAYEIASRLSYHFWNTMPDDELFAAAADGRLLNEDGYGEQVDRLFNDPRSERSIREFYEDFFRVQDIPDVNIQDGPGGWSNVRYHTGPEGQVPHTHWNNSGNTLNGIVEAMASELVNLGRWFTRLNPGSYEDMFRSNLHLMSCSEGWDERCFGAGPWSQSTYEIDGNCVDRDDCFEREWFDTDNAWDGMAEPIELPEVERAGLITRMAFLAHDTLAARPIRRGLKIREILLCDPVPPPENCDVVKPPEVDGDDQVLMTVRGKVEAITETPGTTCAQCHSTLINGFGHALNHFSSVGRYWETEHMFTNERSAEGELWYFVRPPEEWPEIDARGETVLNGEVVAFDGAHEAVDTLVDSGRLEWCWSREYFRFAIGRSEWNSDDAAIDELTASLRDGATLGDAFRDIAYIPQFREPYRFEQMGNEGGQP